MDGEVAIAACPFLPIPAEPVSAKDSKALGDHRGERFYRLCLDYAQTKWLSGFPAQALLQLNRAMSADLAGDEACLSVHPLPYPAVAWMLQSRPDRAGFFFGNPRRHWQHYASRMSGERAQIRSWRAWACWVFAVRILPVDEFPPDTNQIEDEALHLPTPAEIEDGLDRFGLPGESGDWRRVLDGLG